MLADITQLSTGGGYRQGAGGGLALDTVTLSEASGTAKVTIADEVFTASGSVGPFRYVPYYNDTATSPADALVCWFDSRLEHHAGHQRGLLLDHDATNGLPWAGLTAAADITTRIVGSVAAVLSNGRVLPSAPRAARTGDRLARRQRSARQGPARAHLQRRAPAGTRHRDPSTCFGIAAVNRAIMLSTKKAPLKPSEFQSRLDELCAARDARSTPPTHRSRPSWPTSTRRPSAARRAPSLADKIGDNPRRSAVANHETEIRC